MSRVRLIEPATGRTHYVTVLVNTVTPPPAPLYICPACNDRACPGTLTTCPARWR